jgi:hypothetical protein
MVERKGVSSRANLLISARYLWVTLSLFGHHTRVVALNSFFKNTKETKNGKRMGLKKNALQMKVPHTLYKGTQE